MSDIKTKILSKLDDLMSNFLYYNRKEDDDLPVGAIEQAVIDGNITCEDMSRKFHMIIEKSVEEKRADSNDI